MTGSRTQLLLLASAVALAASLLGVRVAVGQQEQEAAVVGAITAGTLADADAMAVQVYAIIEENCLRCHGLDPELAGGLDLRTEAGLQAGGENGRVVVPHDPDASPMYRQIARTSRPYMPFAKPQLPADQVELIRRWIVAGASLAGVTADVAVGERTPADLARLEDRPITAEERAYWAFVEPVRPSVPTVETAGWDGNPIDAFLLRDMREQGLEPGVLADRRSLVRRLYLDVLGLPPSPEQVEAFLDDARPDAWERLVDEVLASPHYGERWARHWMDLARYADSGGFEFDVDRPQMYRYRDYLVDSFNADKPYDQFVIEQLAGDEVGTGEAVIATGFLRVGPEAGAGELNRLDELDDLITATSLTFMGVTVGCARCHDHKFDPIAQKDYYRMQAVFYPTVRTWQPLSPETDVAANRAARARYAELLEPLRDAKRALERPFHRVLMDREIATLAKYLRDAWNTSEEDRTDGQKLNVIQMESSLAVDSLRGSITEDAVVELMPPNVVSAHASVKAEIVRLEAERPAALPAARVIGEAGRDPEPSYFLHRGSAGSPGSAMTPGVLAVATDAEWTFEQPPADAKSSWRRRGFAQWLVNEDNPLTPRVMANRLWQHHFAEGIVRTPSNFGVMGTPPTHPELLDWLAVEFVERGWSMKAMHRLMLTSRAYRTSSDDVAANVAIDPGNRYVWRMPRVRLEAEIIRDSILATAGTLDRTVGGPAVFPYIDPDLFEASTERNWPGLSDDDARTWRRSLYVFSKRSIRYPMFEAFDQPNLVSSVGRRNRTTIAPQALILMNNPTIAFQATQFAARVRREAGDDVESQVARAIEVALGRPPSPAELGNGVEYVTEGIHGLVDFCHMLFNLNEFLYRP